MTLPTTLCDRPGSLFNETQKLLKKQTGGVLAVSQKTGVPFYWLRKFAADKIKNPSVNRVQFLYEKLSGAKIL